MAATTLEFRNAANVPALGNRNHLGNISLRRRMPVPADGGGTPRVTSPTFEVGKANRCCLDGEENLPVSDLEDCVLSALIVRSQHVKISHPSVATDPILKDRTIFLSLVDDSVYGV